MKENEKHNKQTIAGLCLILFGYLLMAFSRFFGGTDLLDFMSGLLAGISVGITLVGTYVAVRTLRRDENDSGGKDE